MPIQQPFTEDGVNNKLTAIYALDDAALAAEAALLKADFIAWMEANFTLTTEQDTYLSAMSATTIAYLSDRLSFCFLHRITINFSKPVPTSSGYVKWTETKDKTKTRSNASGAFDVSGSFELAIIYEYN
ncbi:MAG: hypothetical protein BGO31_01680 [Bacteroidetes bacterium 43-16]|nr:MAG: hypothetical protein BGO31_01680 [Bacteroidetes bacterium 43-16]